MGIFASRCLGRLIDGEYFSLILLSRGSSRFKGRVCDVEDWGF